MSDWADVRKFLDTAPPWATAAVADRSGWVWAYSGVHSPADLMEGYTALFPRVRGYKIEVIGKVDLAGRDWRESLVIRETVQE